MQSLGKLVILGMNAVSSGSPADPLSVLRSPVLWGIAGVGTGVFLFFRGFPYLKRKRLIQNTPTSSAKRLTHSG
jgi:hypothetical protein